ncbi:sarcosine oxidase subunit delta [Striga asiatica]|uniref:Sarcosine oxidase subunit delta n=1 Tax=Striga asiatica TaxID=4170 RepID=A0A5A7R8D4_STRAF|nr:sarcosine oxidase subunit delta [Striga asiatica]
MLPEFLYSGSCDIAAPFGDSERSRHLAYPQCTVHEKKPLKVVWWPEASSGGCACGGLAAHYAVAYEFEAICRSPKKRAHCHQQGGADRQGRHIYRYRITI